jgi:RNA polymerase sigma-70 factor (ECF subfamily)
MADDTTAFGRVWMWAVPAREADWDALYAEQLPRVYNFFRYRVGDGPVAEDLTSTTFEKAWRARHRYRRDLGAFTTWLLTIARNVAVDHFRQRRPTVTLDEAGELPAPGAADEAAERRSEIEHLGRLLAALPDRERELVSLKYGAGLTNRAIARLTGLTESNVGTLIHRTIAALRADWERTTEVVRETKELHRG